MDHMQWVPLRTQSSDSQPLLLTKCTFQPTGYHIWLTDLLSIWTASADRRQIIRQALNDDTSIDPSEDASQLEILLLKIGNALSGDEGSVEILKYNRDPEKVELEVTAPLPSPLQPLRWLLHFKLAGKDNLKQEVIDPLFKLGYGLQKREQDLISVIKEKDHVISKLLDRLEASGTDLTSVFPGGAGIKMSKHSNAREQIAKHIKGLGSFDERSWKRKSTKTDFDDLSIDEIVTSTCVNIGDSATISSSRKAHSRNEAPPRPKESQVSKERIVNKGDSSKTAYDDDDDEFQRQATPPSLAKFKSPEQEKQNPSKGTPNGSPPIDNDDTTDDEDSDVAAGKNKVKVEEDSQATKSEPPIARDSKPKSKLGVIGKRRKSPEQEIVNAPSTSDDVDLDDAPAKTTDVPRRSKLGMIGGGKNSKASGDEVTSEMSTQQIEVRKKADNISSIKTRQEKAESEAPVMPKGESVRSLSPESEKAKADRKRQELKDELGKKPPTSRKKRKF